VGDVLQVFVFSGRVYMILHRYLSFFTVNRTLDALSLYIMTKMTHTKIRTLSENETVQKILGNFPQVDCEQASFYLLRCLFFSTFVEPEINGFFFRLGIMDFFC